MKTLRALGIAALYLLGCSDGGQTNNSDGGGSSPDLSDPLRLDIPVGTVPKGLALADVNRDGQNDLLVVRATGAGSLHLLSAKAGQARTFTNTLLNNTAGDTPNGLAVGDIDADGALDAALVNFNGGDLSVLWGGDFTTKVSLGQGSHPGAVAIADFNGDGKADVAAAFLAFGNVSVLPYMNPRSFATAQSYFVGAAPSSLAVGDLNKDGRLDLVLTQRSADRVRILWGQPGGLFDVSKVTDLTTGRGPVAVALGDLNKDGAPDLVVACATEGSVSVLLSQGTGFASPASYQVGAEPVAVAIGDLDGDQVLDAAVVNRGGGTVSVLRGRAAGMLEAAGTLGVGIEPEAVVIGDLDADGKNDLAVANTGSGTVSVLWGPR